MGVHREVESWHMVAILAFPPQRLWPCVQVSRAISFGGIMGTVFRCMPESFISHGKDLAAPDFLRTRILFLGEDKKGPLIRQSLSLMDIADPVWKHNLCEEPFLYTLAVHLISHAWAGDPGNQAKLNVLFFLCT